MKGTDILFEFFKDVTDEFEAIQSRRAYPDPVQKDIVRAIQSTLDNRNTLNYDDRAYMLIERSHYEDLMQRLADLPGGDVAKCPVFLVKVKDEVTTCLISDKLEDIEWDVEIHDYRKGADCPECGKFTLNTMMVIIRGAIGGTSIGDLAMCRNCFAAGNWVQEVDEGFCPF